MELAPGWCGAGDGPLHPAAAPASRMDTQASASRALPAGLVSTMRSTLAAAILLLKEEPSPAAMPGFLPSAEAAGQRGS
jgi:hypothetical protein